MGRSKSPVDELVDGIDAIGSILDENLPRIKSRIEDLNDQQRDNNNSLSDMRHTVKAMDEAASEIKKAITNLDIRIEEILGTIGALARRLDQLQKSILDLTLSVEKGSDDIELADTVKGLEDRLRNIERRTGNSDFTKRF